jgi:hypothetical protein
MTRYLYGENGGTIGYMDRRDQYLFAVPDQEIAYWDTHHKYMLTPRGNVFGVVDSRGQYLYSLNGTIIGYFYPPY